MYSRLFAFAALAMAASLSAQSNQLEIWAGTSYTSRGNAGKNPVELSEEFDGSSFTGLGDNGKGCVMGQAGAILQDQNKMTQEKFSVVVRKGDNVKGPVLGKAGELGRAGPYATPKGTAPGAAAWGFGFTFKTPVALSCTGTNFLGIQTGASPNWSADGLSCHAGNNTKMLQHLAAKDHAWQIYGTPAAAKHPSAKRAWRIQARFTSAVAQTCNTAPASAAPLCGEGGQHPDTAAIGGQGLQVKVTDKLAGQVESHLFVGLRVSPKGLPVLGPNSRLWISPTFIMYGGKATLTGGIGYHVLHKSLPKGLIGTIVFQGLTVGAKLANPRFTNVTTSTMLK